MNGHAVAVDCKQTPNPKKLLINTNFTTSLLSQLNELRLNKQFTDAVLSVDQEELHCHRYVHLSSVLLLLLLMLGLLLLPHPMHATETHV